MGGGSVDMSLFTTSALFTEVFDLPWKIHKSMENPEMVLMDPDEQPSLMTLRPEFVEDGDGKRLFDRFRQHLSDFLSMQTGRVPLPRARWKDLFASVPSSVASMEAQLAKLFEQALWAMVNEPAFSITAKELDGQNVEEAVEVLDEDWMDEPE